jgi:hypothetical protein
MTCLDQPAAEGAQVMPTPQAYGHLNERYEYLRALAFKMIMSDAVAFGSAEVDVVFDLVGDMTEDEANAIIQSQTPKERNQ